MTMAEEVHGEQHGEPAQARAHEVGEVDAVKSLLRLQEDDAEIERTRQERQEVEHEVGEQAPLLHRVRHQEDGGEVAHHHQGPEGEQRALDRAQPMALEPALADTHDGAGEPEAEHGEAHHQRAEMRPAADGEHAHDADLQRDDAAGDQAYGQVKGKRRAMVEIDRDGQGGLRCWAVVAAEAGCACMARSPSTHPPLAVVRTDDLVAFHLGEGHERHDLAAVDVLAARGDRTIGTLRLGDLEHALRARRSDRDHHQAA